MKRLLCNLTVLCLLLAFASSVFAGQSLEIRLSDGSRWRGELNDTVKVTFLEQNVKVELSGSLIKVADLYIQIEGDVAGQLRKKTVFRDDIISIETVGTDSDEADRLDSMKRASEKSRSREARKSARGDEEKKVDTGDKLGVFYLPMEGTVGETFRHDEIKMIAEEADKYGRGQIIVLMINSNGGLVIESEKITDTIWDVKKRHRVVAWIKKAISAGASTAMVCDEIYFMTEGTAGSVTTLAGDSSVSEEEAKLGVDFLAEIARKSGYSEHIARCMKLTKYMCSYDKDPETGEVTFYGDTSGEFLLSDSEHNLTFNSSNALHCGFSKGTADTEEDLAKLLDLPEWYEYSDYGRVIAKEWQDTVKRCKEEIPRLFRERELAGSLPTQEAQLGKIIQINKRIIRWIDKCQWPCRLMGLPEKEYYEQENEELRYQLSRLKKR